MIHVRSWADPHPDSASNLTWITALGAAVHGTPPGNACIGNKGLPCAGGVLGLSSYPYTVAEFGPSVTAVVIPGGNHAWTDGNPEGSFVDPVGPSMAHLIHDSFGAHPRS